MSDFLLLSGLAAGDSELHNLQHLNQAVLFTETEKKVPMKKMLPSQVYSLLLWNRQKGFVFLKYELRKGKNLKTSISLAVRIFFKKRERKDIYFLRILFWRSEFLHRVHCLHRLFVWCKPEHSKYIQAQTISATQLSKYNTQDVNVFSPEM